MTPYLLMLLSIMMLWTFLRILEQRERVCRNDAAKAFLIMTTIILSLVEGLRAGSVGTDTTAYIRIFQRYETAKQEIGFIELCRLIHLLSDDPTVFLMVCAFITNGCIAIASYKLSKNPYMSMVLWVMLYYYFNSFNGLRQYIAVGLLVLAFYSASNKKWLQYTLFQILAFLFHQTAFIGLIFLLIFNFNGDTRIRKLKNVVLLFMATLIPAFWDGLMSFVVLLFPSYGFYLKQSNNFVTASGGISQPIVYSMVFLAFIVLTDPQSKARERYTTIMFIAVLVSLLQMRYQAFGRFLWYFDVLSIFVIPEICVSNYRVQSERIQMLIQTGLISICALFMLYYLSLGSMRVTPYVSVLS